MNRLLFFQSGVNVIVSIGNFKGVNKDKKLLYVNQ